VGKTELYRFLYFWGKIQSCKCGNLWNPGHTPPFKIICFRALNFYTVDRNVLEKPAASSFMVDEWTMQQKTAHDTQKRRK
jgi:hypothetical protein